MSSKWKRKPKEIRDWTSKANYALFIDENGTSDLKYIKKCVDNNLTVSENHRYFNLTGLLVKKEQMEELYTKGYAIKEKYWQNGCYEYLVNKKTRKQKT